MPLYRIAGSRVKKLSAKDLDLEKRLQALFEANLDEILNITFLAHEYSTSFGGRIDTLGIDKNGSPCIIEYKRTQNDNVINQGLSYLHWLIDHKADFEMLCRSKSVDLEIDWDSPRVICVAESYNKFDIDTANFLPIKIELFRYRIYEEDILFLEAEGFQKVKVATSGIVRKGKEEKEVKLQKEYTVEDHLGRAGKDVVALFHTLRERIMSLDESIREEPKKLYVAYKLSTNFADVILYKDEIRITLNVRSGDLNDPNGITTDFTKPKKGHWGNGDYEVKLRNETELDSVFELVKQSYDINK